MSFRKLSRRVIVLSLWRAGHIAHEQSIATLRRRHRICAQLTGPLTQIPESLTGQHLRSCKNLLVMLFWNRLTLSPGYLDWLSGLPLSELKIEPVGLSVVYDRYHREDGRHNDTASLPQSHLAFLTRSINLSLCGILQSGGKHGETKHCSV